MSAIAQDQLAGVRARLREHVSYTVPEVTAAAVPTVLFVALSLAGPVFPTADNLSTIGAQTAVIRRRR